MVGVRALEAKNGFRTYKFGTPIEKISGLRKIDSSDFDGQVYERPAEHMGVGPTRLTSLLFISIKGRLSGFVLGCYGSSNAANLLAILQSQYGSGLVYSDNHVTWPGKKVTMDYTFSGGENEKCTVVILSNTSANERAGLADEKAIKKGTKDL